MSAPGLKFRVQGLEVPVKGLEIWVQGFGDTVWGLRIRDEVKD